MPVTPWSRTVMKYEEYRSWVGQTQALIVCCFLCDIPQTRFQKARGCLEYTAPLPPGMLGSRSASSRPSSPPQTETDPLSLLPDRFHVRLHRCSYHTEPPFTLLAPSLGCEFPEASDSVLFLFLSFASRIVFVHFGHTSNVC